MKHLVTGAGSGIGTAIARALADRGDELVLIARNEDRAAELRTEFARAEVVVADLADPAAIAGLSLPERLDSVIHSAGVVTVAAVTETTPDDVRAQLDINLLAPILLTRACLPAVRAARGTVVFINSTSGINANPGWGAYAASKFGLRGFADALREEERTHGVRVTSVFPSRTATRMQAEVHASEGRDYDPSVWIQPTTVATMVLDVLDLADDAVVPEVVIRPR